MGSPAFLFKSALSLEEKVREKGQEIRW